jgi:hypothetical protein
MGETHPKGWEEWREGPRSWAALVEEWRMTTLRDKIAAVIWHSFYDEPAKNITYVALDEAADAVLALLREGPSFDEMGER